MVKNRVLTADDQVAPSGKAVRIYALPNANCPDASAVFEETEEVVATVGKAVGSDDVADSNENNGLEDVVGIVGDLWATDNVGDFAGCFAKPTNPQPAKMPQEAEVEDDDDEDYAPTEDDVPM